MSYILFFTGKVNHSLKSSKLAYEKHMHATANGKKQSDYNISIHSKVSLKN